MPHRKQKEVKASSKPAGRVPAQDQPHVNLKHDLLFVGLFLIGAWLFWRILRKHRRTSSRKEISQAGYILVDGQLEHRLIAERGLGRKLVPGEVVHHINGIKTDNRKSNLCVLDSYAHDQFHDWLKWKVEKEGGYPAKRYQRAVLRYRYNGILLVTYSNDLPPLDSAPKLKRGRNVS